MAKKALQADDLESFAWDAPVDSVSPQSAGHETASRESRAARSGDPAAPAPPGIRDHYIADRFPGIAECGRDLEQVARIITGARLYFEEHKSDRALELLDLAIEQCPYDEPLRLARLEIAFLTRDAALYVRLATEFRMVRGTSEAWTEIARLGRALAPDEALFGAKQGRRTYEQYGPWPQMPNWINASYDMTPEVLAADYHRLMARTAPPTAKLKARIPTTKKR